MEDDAANSPQDPNHISTLRRHLLEQVSALRSASSTEEVQREIDRSKAIAELAQAVVNTAKVEVDYLKITGQPSTPFLHVPPVQQRLPDASGDGLPGPPANGITSVVRHRLRG